MEEGNCEVVGSKGEEVKGENEKAGTKGSF
jgi:hypothetical protein